VATICPTCGRELGAEAPHANATDCIAALRQAHEKLELELVEVQRARRRDSGHLEEFHAALAGIADLIRPDAMPELHPVILDQIKKTAETCVRMRDASPAMSDTSEQLAPQPFVLEEEVVRLLEAHLPDLRRIADRGPGSSEDAPLVQALASLALATLYTRFAEDAGKKMVK
jgi:hypothetical protein